MKAHIRWDASEDTKVQASGGSVASLGSVQKSEPSFAAKMLKEGEEQGAPRNLFEAAERGLVGYIVRIVERSLEFDINQRDKLQRTALHWAAELNRVEVAEALIDYGIDPTAVECNGRTAVHLAAREGHADMLKVIMENLSDPEREMLVNQRDLYGITPVYLSLQKGEESRKAFDFLMECGGKYNSNSSSAVVHAHEEAARPTTATTTS